MSKRIAVFIAVIGSVIASGKASACSCVSRDLKQLYSDSDVVYVAEVTLVRLVTRNPMHNSRAVYEIELRPLRIFKGRDPGVQKARFTSTYHDKSPVVPSPDGELREVAINSCDMNYVIGEVFLILKKRAESLGTVGYCSPGFVHNPTVEHIKLIERLSP